VPRSPKMARKKRKGNSSKKGGEKFGARSAAKDSMQQKKPATLSTVFVGWKMAIEVRRGAKGRGAAQTFEKASIRGHVNETRLGSRETLG